MCDLVARGKPKAHPREQRGAVPGLVMCRWASFRRHSRVPRLLVPRRLVTTRYKNVNREW